MDLPLHPLIAHSSVVLVPAASILLILAVLLRSARRYVAVVGVVAAVLGAISAYLSMISGEDLSAIVGTPDDHARWGFYAVYSAAGLAVFGLIWFILVSPQRADAAADSARSRARPRPTARAFGALTVLAGIAATVFMILIGHSGAQAVWSDVEETGGPQAPGSESPEDEDAGSSSASSPTAEEGSSGPAEDGGDYSMREVESRDSAESCWTVIDGTVYDLTDWIGQHPGGEQAIEGLCGTDGSDTFNAQHGGSAQQEQRLEDYALGELADE